MSPHSQVTDFPSLPDFTAADLPAEDRFKFESLSASEISAWSKSCEAKYRRKIIELKTYIATVRSLRNTFSPISRLPNEVLAHVFADSSLILQTRIRRVCRRWRSVVLASPRFWAKCVSYESFVTSHRDATFLRAALKQSGALSITIHLKDSHPESMSTIWYTLLDYCTRIADLFVKTSDAGGGIPLGLDRLFRFGRMDKLDRLYLDSKASSSHSGLQRPDWDQENLPALRTLITSGVVLPYMGVASLTTLSLENAYLDPTMLIDVLNKCPSLETLHLAHGALTVEDPNVDDRAIFGPRLREVAINDTAHDMSRVLGIFRSHPFSTHTRLTLHCSSDRRPTIEYQQLFAPPHLDRTCIEPYYPFDPEEDAMMTRTFSDSRERLRIEFLPFEDPVESDLPPISVLIVNSLDEEFDDVYLEAIAEWDLPCLQRLEITNMSPPSQKRQLATIFLDRFGHRASELSLAWVLRLQAVDAGQETQSLAEEELQDLLDVLRRHGSPRLGRLELYAAEQGEYWEPFQGSIEAGSDARLCSKIVQPFLADLREWVDVVHIG